MKTITFYRIRVEGDYLKSALQEYMVMHREHATTLLMDTLQTFLNRLIANKDVDQTSINWGTLPYNNNTWEVRYTIKGMDRKAYFSRAVVSHEILEEGDCCKFFLDLFE